MAPSLRRSARWIFAGIQPQITGDLFAASKRVIGPMARTKASEVTGPIPGWVIKSTASGRRWACSKTARSNSAIAGFELVEQFQKFFAPSAGPRR